MEQTFVSEERQARGISGQSSSDIADAIEGNDIEIPPASQLALESLVRRNRLGWIYIFLFHLVAQVIEPRVNRLPGWGYSWAAEVCLCGARIWLMRGMSRPNGLTPTNIRLFGWAVALHALCMSVTISLWYLTFGFDQKALLATLVLAVYALGALVVYRPNLRILRQMVIGYLALPVVTALWIGGAAGWAITAHILAVLIFCLYQGSVENFEFWGALHATRDLKIARRRAEAASKIQAELIANRARQSTLIAERTRIAAEWHDTLLAGFSAIAWQIDTAQTTLHKEPKDASKALEVARTMLDHYRAEARLVIADLQSLPDGRDLKSAVEHALKPLLRDRPVKLKLEVDGHNPTLPSGKKHHIIRICQEAVANALQHASPTSINVKIENERAKMTVEIRDDGAGFQRVEFQPGHAGLEIMRERAQRIGGELKIYSQPGLGTKVVLNVPPEPKAQRANARILIVDGQSSRVALRSVLESREDLRIVAEATSGEAGIELFRQHSPDLAIVDLKLPAASGFEVIKGIREADPFANVVVVSNLDGADYIRRAAELGAAAYLTKDVSGQELLQVIDAVLAGVADAPETAVAEGPQTNYAERELSGRERDVLEQLVQGLSNRDIAIRLGVAEKTVQVRIMSILSKFGTNDRSEAAAIAVQGGAVDAPAHSSSAARV